MSKRMDGNSDHILSASARFIVGAAVMACIGGVGASTGPFGGENILFDGSFESGRGIESADPGKVSEGWFYSDAGIGRLNDNDWVRTGVALPDGVQCAYVTNSGYVVQTFRAPASGLYRLTMSHAARMITDNPLGQRIDIIVDGTVRGSIKTWSIAFEQMHLDIPLAAGLHTLRFQGNDHDGRTALIDAVSVEIPADPGKVLTNIDEVGFRFDFTSGAVNTTGTLFTPDSDRPLTTTAADGPAGDGNAAVCTAGSGMIAYGDRSMNGDWSVTMSCRPTAAEKRVMVCVGGVATVDRRALLVCSQSDSALFIGIGQRHNASESGCNLPTGVSIGNLWDLTTRFHAITCVHRRETNLVKCYVDGVLMGYFWATEGDDGIRSFASGLQFNAPYGGTVEQISAAADGERATWQDFRFYERALSDEEVAAYARAYPALRPSKLIVESDVNPTSDTVYESNPSANGTLFVPAGVTVTTPYIFDHYFNYGKIVVTGKGTFCEAPRGPGVMCFAGTGMQYFADWAAFGNSPVEIAGKVFLCGGNNKIVSYCSSPVTVVSGEVGVDQPILGDKLDSDYWDSFGSVFNFRGGTMTAAGDWSLFSVGGHKTRNDINITGGRFPVRVAVFGKPKCTGTNRCVNVGGTGVFAPPSLAYKNGDDPGENLRLTVRLHDGGTFEIPSPLPPYVAIDGCDGRGVLKASDDFVANRHFSQDAASELVFDGAHTFDLRGVTLAGGVSLANDATVRLHGPLRLAGGLTLAKGTKVKIDLSELRRSGVAIATGTGVNLPQGERLGSLIQFENAPVGAYPKLSDDGKSVMAAFGLVVTIR